MLESDNNLLEITNFCQLKSPDGQQLPSSKIIISMADFIDKNCSDFDGQNITNQQPSSTKWMLMVNNGNEANFDLVAEPIQVLTGDAFDFILRQCSFNGSTCEGGSSSRFKLDFYDQTDDECINNGSVTQLEWLNFPHRNCHSSSQLVDDSNDCLAKSVESAQTSLRFVFAFQYSFLFSISILVIWGTFNNETNDFTVKCTLKGGLLDFPLYDNLNDTTCTPDQKPNDSELRLFFVNFDGSVKGICFAGPSVLTSQQALSELALKQCGIVDHYFSGCNSLEKPQFCLTDVSISEIEELSKSGKDSTNEQKQQLNTISNTNLNLLTTRSCVRPQFDYDCPEKSQSVMTRMNLVSNWDKTRLLLVDTHIEETLQNHFLTQVKCQYGRSVIKMDQSQVVISQSLIFPHFFNLI